MEISNKYIFNKKHNEELDNSVIAQIIFEELHHGVPEVMGKPIICYSCGAAVLNIDTIKEKEPAGLHFTCEFCNSVNKIDEEQFNRLKAIRKGVVEYLEESEKIPVSPDRIVACIDISGSMRGNPLEGVKKSLIETLKDLSINSPDTKFALITFTDYVALYNSLGKQIMGVDNGNLYDKFIIRRIFGQGNYELETVRDSWQNWIKFISTLTSSSDTALGPAVLAAVSLLKNDGRIILLTDGLANRGLGNLQTPVGGRKGDFYRSLGHKSAAKGIMIEIVGVSSSPQARIELETIGEMARLTGGDIYMVDLSEIGKVFGTLSQTDSVGKNVKLKMYMPGKMKLRGATGDLSFKRLPNSIEAQLGYVNPDRKVCVALEPSEDLPVKEEIPVQVQIEYVSADGNIRKRIYQEKLFVTDEEKEIIDNFKSEVSDLYYQQKSAQMAQHGKEAGGIEELQNYKKELDRYQTKGDEAVRKRIGSSVNLMDKKIQDMAKLQKEKSKDVKYSQYRSISASGISADIRSVSRQARITRPLSEIERDSEIEKE